MAAVHTSDAAATFSSIALKGDFYNGMRGGKNMVLTFEDSTVRGVISASKAQHGVSSIDASNFHELGMVTNTAQPAVNNGVIVQLNSGSTWTVTGTSYLTKLVVDDDAAVSAPRGKSVTLTVDGTEADGDGPRPTDQLGVALLGDLVEHGVRTSSVSMSLGAR
ncbi:hypothetical protein [Streptomyces hawaiiensis]|uniref:hypothetical protein n=1 Tax=Streptomyces hawaiiensis TaxID=67305 RepID=UPI00364AD960